MVELNKQKLEDFGKPFVVAEAGINHNCEILKAF